MPLLPTPEASLLLSNMSPSSPLVRRTIRPLIVLRTVIRLTPLPFTVLILITWMTRSPNTDIPLTNHPRTPHVLHFLTLLHQHLEVSNSQ
ncbi:hypothetical protein A2U01_0056546, partial [Trifolium medium]|nr:hypothetical protein [Trifolium medium]